MASRDEFADPVRRYVVTGGRAAPTGPRLRPERLLIAEPGQQLPPEATPEQRSLVEMCQGLLSLAEAAAHLAMPVSVVAVVASDLVASGHLSVRNPAAPTATSVPEWIVKEVLDGLRARL